jgi:hypothetical protein
VTVRIPVDVFREIHGTREMSSVIRKAIEHVRLCPHWPETRWPIALTATELRRAPDPFAALREEFSRVYEEELAETVRGLQRLCLPNRETYNPDALAPYVHRLGQLILAIYNLIAPNHRDEKVLKRQFFPHVPQG